MGKSKIPRKPGKTRIGPVVPESVRVDHPNKHMSSHSPRVITPLPVRRISVLGLILAANNTSIWMIFAFLPFMVQHYYPYLTAKELGYKAGLLGIINIIIS